MKKIKLKVGDVLLAKDECIMTNDGKPSLTIGKYYTVKSSVDGEFMVIDDQKCQHFFDISNLDEYFYIPNKLVAPSAKAKPIVLDELGQTETKVLDAQKWGELVEAPKEKKSLKNSSIIKTFKAENEALLQSNTEFKKLHKKLLKANQESMERRIELGTANSKLLSEIEKLKIWVEAEKDEIKKLYTVIYEQSDEIKERKADIFYLEETIELQKETIATLTQMKVAPKKEQSIFFDLLEHLNIIKK